MNRVEQRREAKGAKGGAMGDCAPSVVDRGEHFAVCSHLSVLWAKVNALLVFYVDIPGTGKGNEGRSLSELVVPGTTGSVSLSEKQCKFVQLTLLTVILLLISYAGRHIPWYRRRKQS